MNRAMRQLVLVMLMGVGAAGTVAAQQATTPPAPQFTVSGVAYAQYNYALSGDQHLNAFDVTRTYLNFNGKFAGGVTTRVTPDIYRVTNGDGSLTYRLKYAYVGYQTSSSAPTFKFGMIQTPWVGREEDLWGYRMQGTIAVDRNKFLSSSDFGLSMDTRMLGGRLDLNAGIYNGETYSKAEGDQRKDFAVRASFRLAETDDNSATGGLRLSGYAGIGKPTGGGERNRYIGMLSYATSRITLAAEYGVMRDSSTVTPTARTDASVMSAFGVLRLPSSKLALIGRVDMVDPNTDVDDDGNTRVIAGASYQVSPNLRALVDVDLLSHEAGDPEAAIDPRNQFLFQLQFTY